MRLPAFAGWAKADITPLNFGTMSEAGLMRPLYLLATHVMPRLRDFELFSR
jgi:hypothetical protein